MQRDCSACIPGFFGFGSSGCSDCTCNTLGTVNGSTVCDAVTGQCPCSPGNTGRTCSQCRVGFFQLPLAAAGVCVACDPQCSDAGCLGPGNAVAACGTCRNVQFSGVCIDACPVGHYADSSRICQPCDAQCTGGCTGVAHAIVFSPLVVFHTYTWIFICIFLCIRACMDAPFSCSTLGAGPAMCNACASVKLGSTCIASCPLLSFPDSAKNCQTCNSECKNSCAGPAATDCDSCKNYFDRLLGCVARCPSGTYSDASNTCQPCHPECDSQGCTGPLQTNCLKCARITSVTTSTPTCVSACPALSYLLNDTSSVQTQQAGTPVCLSCNAQCARGCQVGLWLVCVLCSNRTFIYIYIYAPRSPLYSPP
jgi:proprotein convertase subtilisin/kexin type 5